MWDLFCLVFIALLFNFFVIYLLNTKSCDMKKSILFLISILCLGNIALSQNTLFYNAEPGTVDYIRNLSALKVADGNSTIAASYTNTACGLSYTQASVFLSNKSFTFGPGVSQPAPLVVTGLPFCHSVLKAFLYVSTSGTGTPITATLTNPQNVTASFSMTIIGQGADVCWGYSGSRSYRADVTSIVTGGGTYALSGIPVAANPGSDAQGATLFIIYQDVTQNYSGSIVMADGAAVGLSLKSATVGGFNICGSPVTSSNFMIVSDLQKFQDAPLQLNSTSTNYTLTMANQTAHNFISSPVGPVSAAQSTASYGVGSVGADCFNIVLAGFHYRSSCLSCTVAQSTPPNTPTISIITSSNIICSGNSATLTASGASTYSWSNGATTSSIVVTPTTTTTYWVYSNNANGCSNALFTQSVNICSGINENEWSNVIKLFPNPSKGIFKIELNEKIEKPEIEIYNSIGQLIFKNSLKENTNSIDISKFAAGYYYAVITSKGEKIYKEKIIIE